MNAMKRVRPMQAHPTDAMNLPADALLGQPRLPDIGEPGDFEPDPLPVEPDEGPVPPFIPDDPEHERLVYPASLRAGNGPRRTKAPRSVPGLPLPHERDESTGSAATTPDPVIEQAKRDIDAGQVDTDMHATPGLDAQRRARLVPTPRGPR